MQSNQSNYIFFKYEDVFWELHLFFLKVMRVFYTFYFVLMTLFLRTIYEDVQHEFCFVTYELVIVEATTLES